MESPTRIRSNVLHATCAACGGDFRLTGRLMIGEVFQCESCRAQLEVADLDPPVLEPLAKIEEDEEDFEGF